MSGFACMRVYVRKAADSWILFRSYLGFHYVCTGSCESICDTSITEVVVIPRRNSPYYVAYTCSWILEPSVYIEWLWDWVTSLCCRLLLGLASSIELHHLAGMSIPPIPWPITLFPTTEAIRVISCRKQPFC